METEETKACHPFLPQLEAKECKHSEKESNLRKCVVEKNIPLLLLLLLLVLDQRTQHSHSKVLVVVVAGGGNDEKESQKSYPRLKSQEDNLFRAEIEMEKCHCEILGKHFLYPSSSETRRLPSSFALNKDGLWP